MNHSSYDRKEEGIFWGKLVPRWGCIMGAISASILPFADASGMKGGENMRWVIIGGDAAGMSGACRARCHDRPWRSSFSRSLIMARMSPLAPATFRDHLGIDSRAGHWVAGIDRNAGKVVGTRRDGVPFTVGYDRLRRLVGLRQFPGARSTSPDERLFHGNEVIFPAA